MRALFLHSEFLEVEARQKAIPQAEEVKERKISIPEESLVVFVAVEKGDDISLSEELAKHIVEISKKIGLKTKKIVLYPYVHLTNNPSDPQTALQIILKTEEILKKEGFDVVHAPFGWYKAFTIKVKGHPLAELSRTILKKVKKEEKKLEKRFVILFPDGRDYLVVGEEGDKVKVIKWNVIKEKVKNLNEISEKLPEVKEAEYIEKKIFNEDFRRLLDKEALGKPFEEKEKNPINDILKRFGFEWEPLSDYGHMRYKPYASLIFDLVSDYSLLITKDLPFPVFVIKGTNMFDLNSGPVAEHAKLFGERMYEVQTDKSKFVLRYAACFQQFSIAKDLVISYKNLPFGMLEIADSYRFEQPGEIVLGFRLRKFVMPDLHVFCKDLEEARKLFLVMHRKIMDEMKKLGRNYELLINVGSPEFYEKYKEIIMDIVRDVNKPVLICIYPPAEERYWIINIEYHIVDILGRPREIGTTQIDIGNGKRFGIKYVDENGKEHYVVILHNAILGSVERYIYALFDTALRKEKPMLPLWISPVQVRVIPVSKKYLDYAREIAKELERNNIRVELDDRDETLNKKIMDAEKLWIPYIIVVGKKEKEKGILSVRVRDLNQTKEYTLQELINEIKEKTKGYPFRPLYGPMELSKKPSNI